MRHPRARLETVSTSSSHSTSVALESELSDLSPQHGPQRVPLSGLRFRTSKYIWEPCFFCSAVVLALVTRASLKQRAGRLTGTAPSADAALTRLTRLHSGALSYLQLDARQL